MKGYANIVARSDQYLQWTRWMRMKRYPSVANAMARRSKKKKIQLLENLNLTIGDGCVEQGFKRVSNEQEALITEMALAVLFGKLDKAICQIGSMVITISTASEKVKVKRVEKKAMALEG